MPDMMPVKPNISLYKHVKNVKVYVPYARHDAVRNI